MALRHKTTKLAIINKNDQILQKTFTEDFFETVGVSRGYTDHHQGRGQP